MPEQPIPSETERWLSDMLDRMFFEKVRQPLIFERCLPKEDDEDAS